MASPHTTDSGVLEVVPDVAALATRFALCLLLPVANADGHQNDTDATTVDENTDTIEVPGRARRKGLAAWPLFAGYTSPTALACLAFLAYRTMNQQASQDSGRTKDDAAVTMHQKLALRTPWMFRDDSAESSPCAGAALPPPLQIPGRHDVQSRKRDTHTKQDHGGDQYNIVNIRLSETYTRLFDDDWSDCDEACPVPYESILAPEWPPKDDDADDVSYYSDSDCEEAEDEIRAYMAAPDPEMPIRVARKGSSFDDSTSESSSAKSPGESELEMVGNDEFFTYSPPSIKAPEEMKTWK